MKAISLHFSPSCTKSNFYLTFFFQKAVENLQSHCPKKYRIFERIDESFLRLITIENISETSKNTEKH